MKTIEERAKEYQKRYFSKAYDLFQSVAKVAYTVGAEEQKAIDDAEWLKIKSSWEKEAQTNHDDELNYKQGYHDAVEKACKACENELRRLKILLNESAGVPANLISVGKSLSRIRKEMYEDN